MIYSPHYFAKRRLRFRRFNFAEQRFLEGLEHGDNPNFLGKVCLISPWRRASPAIGQGWKRVPVKTDAGTTFFVLHDLLRQIGFVDWAAAHGDEFLFPELMRLEDPSKGANAYMGRLFKKAGAVEKRKVVFRSLRGGNIELMRDNKVDPRDRKLQAGHSLEDEHDLYGFRAICEKRAREMAHAPLEEDVDYSGFQGLD